MRDATKSLAALATGALLYTASIEAADSLITERPEGFDIAIERVGDEDSIQAAKASYGLISAAAGSLVMCLAVGNAVGSIPRAPPIEERATDYYWQSVRKNALKPLYPND